MDDFYVEPGIKPLVDTMNATGRLKTIGSCEGHRTILGVRPPYVYFKGDLSFAEKFGAEVFGYGLIEGKLNYEWRFIALFHPKWGMCLHLCMSSEWFRRRRVAEDVQLLSDLVSDLAK